MADPKKELNNAATNERKLDPVTIERQQWSALSPLIHQPGNTQDPNLVEATTQPVLVKEIYAQTEVIEKPPRTPRVGLIDPLEETFSQTLDPNPNPATHPDESDLNGVIDIPEDINDIFILLDLFSNPKIIPHKFRPSVGDVIIAAKTKRPSLKPDPVLEATDTTTAMEAKPLEFYPDNGPSEINGLLGLYQDSFYFIDEGEYRKKVSDAYEFQQGDIVACLGNFNQHWHWCSAPRFNFYLYYPKHLEGECCQGPGEMGPWFLLNSQETSQNGGLEPDPPPVPYPSISPSDLLPFSTLSYPFEFRDGDILMHHTNDKTLFKPWNLGMDVTVENSKTRGELERILQPMDEVLRYGVHVEHDEHNGRESTTIYVELFQYHGGSEWKFLGKNEGLYNNVATLPAMIRFNVNTPHPGDIFINRRSNREWDVTEQTGGIVEIFRDENFFSSLKEPREKLKNHRWGIGSDTTVVRFGTFATKEWNWMSKPSVDIFILNSRGISLRRHCRIVWDNLWRPEPNYNFSLHNPKNMSEVPASFKPTTGDVIIRYLAKNLVWDESVLDHVGEPSVQIAFFNAKHLVGNRLCDGDMLLRVGYERSDQNKHWTHATAELYQYVVNPKSHCKFWKFMGRDTYVFGALPWPERHGLFSGKELEQSYVDPDNDLMRDETARKSDVDHTRAVRLFVSGLGFQNVLSTQVSLVVCHS
ncbi:unnamed protein product [Calypogeia fissa]